MRPTIYGIGLSHEELHTLEVSMPLLFLLSLAHPKRWTKMLLPTL